MAAAAWTEHATDITEAILGGDEEVRERYLTAAQLADRIGLSEATVMDTLTRTPRADDPRSAIYRPAARIGQTKLAAIPRWLPEQAEEYKALAAHGARTRNISELPTYTLAEAADAGLASTEELAKRLGIAENSIRRWARDMPDFPQEVAVAERMPPFVFGPPRTLRRLAEVRDWVIENARLEQAHRTKLLRDRRRERAGSAA